MKKNLSYWSWEYTIFIAGVVLTGGLLITLFTACATQYVPVIKVPTSNALGWTVCDDDGNPAILYLDTTPPNYKRYLLLHEWTHIAQVRAHGDCKDFMLKYSASESMRLEIEAEAECVVYAFAWAEGKPIDPQELWEFFRQRHPNLSVGELKTALYCLEVP